jgi:hypothetical protein
MSRIAYATEETIRIPQLIDTASLRRGAHAIADSCRKAAQSVMKYAAMWYL